MLTTVRQNTEILENGIIQLKINNIRPHTKVNVVAVLELLDKPARTLGEPRNAMEDAKGILKGKITIDPAEWQRQQRSEWDARCLREHGK